MPATLTAQVLAVGLDDALVGKEGVLALAVLMARGIDPSRIHHYAFAFEGNKCSSANETRASVPTSHSAGGRSEIPSRTRISWSGMSSRYEPHAFTIVVPYGCSIVRWKDPYSLCT